MRSHPRVNWGRGRLAPYASQASFAAQFCALNVLQPQVFRKFCSGYLKKDVDAWCPFEDEHLGWLARLLDEPLRTVKTLSASYMQLPAVYGALSSEFLAGTRKQYLSYCPPCLSVGYHAAFHEASWLRLCPIHRLPLELKTFNGSYERYVKALMCLQRDACPRWPDMRASEAPLFSGKSKPLKEFLDWLSAVQRKADALRGQIFYSPQASPYLFSHLTILLGRLEALHPIPQPLVPVFLVAPRHQRQDIESLPNITAALMEQAAKKIQFDMLLYTYVMNAAQLRQQKKFRSDASEAIGALRAKHERCECTWRWDRYTGWFRVRAGQRYSPHALCPYALAIEELAGQWLTFYETGASPRQKRQFRLAYACDLEDLMRVGLAQYIDEPAAKRWADGGMGWNRLVQLSLGGELDEALDIILSKQVKVHRDDLDEWLTLIPSKAHPRREPEPGNVNVFWGENCMWVSSWAREAGHVAEKDRQRCAD